MLEYFLSPVKADLLPTDGGRPPAPTPLVTGLYIHTLQFPDWKKKILHIQQGLVL